MSDTELVLCSCRDPSHQIILEDMSEDGYFEVDVVYHLVKRPFLERLAYAVGYIFGKQSDAGAFGEVILQESQAMQIINFLEKARANNKT